MVSFLAQLIINGSFEEPGHHGVDRWIWVDMGTGKLFVISPPCKRHRIKAGLTPEQVCNRLSERNIAILPADLVRAETDRVESDDDVRNALLDVFSVTLGEIERELRALQ